jgi:hypothetical protein
MHCTWIKAMYPLFLTQVHRLIHSSGYTSGYIHGMFSTGQAGILDVRELNNTDRSGAAPLAGDAAAGITVTVPVVQH